MTYANIETRLSPNARVEIRAGRPVLVRRPGSCRIARKRPASTPEARALVRVLMSVGPMEIQK